MQRQQGRLNLWVRFMIMTTVVGSLLLVAYICWSTQAQSEANERRALAEARTLNAEISATWDYIDSIQYRINHTNGQFVFKDVYCAVAGKRIAQRFSDISEYTIRFVRENPRNLEDEPDEFERAALDSFATNRDSGEGAGGGEYYRMVVQDGMPTFRYVSELTIERNCLDCHGEPAGEKDVAGYLREGMEKGDLAGAVSIVMPLGSVVAEAQNDVTGAVVFFAALLVGFGGVLALGLRFWAARPITEENALLRRETETQSNFLTVITHELKTPLTSILAFTELWKQRHENQPDEEAELVEEVETNSNVLLDLIDNVLDTAKLEAGTLVLSNDEMDAFELAAQVRSTMAPLAKRCGVTLTIDVSPAIPILMTDAEALRRITVNLVNNALRFTPRGGHVLLAMDLAEDRRHEIRPRRLRIRVKDDGAGIAAKELPYVFDRFVSASSSPTTGEGGTGLGLSLVKSYAEMLGGSVTVESGVGAGSEFTVLLPAEAVDAAEEAEDAGDIGETKEGDGNSENGRTHE